MFSSLNPGHVGISASLREGLALAERHGFGGYDAQLAPLHEEVTAHGATAVRDLSSSTACASGRGTFHSCRTG